MKSTALRNQTEFPRNNSRDIQDIFDELGLGRGVALNGFQTAGRRLRIARLIAQDAGPAENRTQRRTQFVRNRCQKLVLGSIGCFSIASRFLLGCQQRSRSSSERLRSEMFSAITSP